MSDVPRSATTVAEEAAARLAGFLRNDLGAKGPIALHEPSFEGNEWAYVEDCLNTGWVSSAGSYVTRIEEMTAEACGAAHGVAVVNGSAGLHAALLALGVGAGDAVVCPALTFIATANAVSYCGAQPLFADVDRSTRGLDAAKLRDLFRNECTRMGSRLVHDETGLRIAAILPVHLFGHPADMAGLVDLAEEFGLPVVEDAAEALGSRYRGSGCGSLGIAGVISFNGNKTVTTGGGGVIVTNDGDLAARLKHLTTTARIPDRWQFDHDAVGFNYRMPNINAALGCAQLELLPRFLARKRQLAECYLDLFQDLGGADVGMLRAPADCESNFWLNALIFPDTASRDQFLNLTNDQGIQTRPCWRLLPDTGAYRNAPCADGLDVARNTEACLVNIPSGPRLSRNDTA